MKIPQIILNNKLTSILIAVILVLGVVLIFKNHKIGTLKGKLDYAVYHDSTETSLTKSGDSIKTVYQVQYKEIPDTRRYDSLLKEMNIKKSHTSSLTTIQTAVRVDTIRAKATTDTVYADGIRKYKYQSKDISFQAEAGQQLELKNLSIPAQLSIVSHTESGHQKLSITSDNKYLHINGITSIDYTEERKPSRWGIGVTGGYGFSKGGFGVTGSVGITYNLIQFKHK